MRGGLFPFLLIVLAACGADRERPGPVDPARPSILSARLLAPPMGATLRTGQDISVRVEARDLRAVRLEGVGFVARRLGSGGATVDSAAVRFPGRSDTVHTFTFQVPHTFPTNTQVDIYGIAFGPGGSADVSEAVHIVMVQCPDATC